MFVNTNLPLQKVENQLLEEKKINLSIYRIDLIHPLISGNKWFKLKYNLQEAKLNSHLPLLTFGGAYSNHIYATAAAGKLFNLQTIGIIRGEETLPLNATLAFAQEQGMQLYYLDRATYRNKQEISVLAEIKTKIKRDFYLIPEGGSNALAVKGCTEILQNLSEDFDYICLPCGTGGTLAGLCFSLAPHQKALGFAVLKNADFLYQSIAQLQLETRGEITQNYHIFLDYHAGGYAKQPNYLIDFCNTFTTQYQIPIEPVYTGKMFWGLWDLIEKDYFPPLSKIIALHTGGIR